MGENGFRAMLESFPDFVLLQLFTRNVFGHVRSPA